MRCDMFQTNGVKNTEIDLQNILNELLEYLYDARAFYTQNEQFRGVLSVGEIHCLQKPGTKAFLSALVAVSS